MRKLILYIISIMLFASFATANEATMIIEDGVLQGSCDFSDYSFQGYEYAFFENGINVSSGIALTIGPTEVFYERETNYTPETNFWTTIKNGFDGDYNTATYCQGGHNCILNITHNLSEYNEYGGLIINRTYGARVALNSFTLNLSDDLIQDYTSYIRDYSYVPGGASYRQIVRIYNFTDASWNYLLYDSGDQGLDRYMKFQEDNITFYANYSSYTSSTNIANTTPALGAQYTFSCRGFNAQNYSQMGEWVNSSDMIIGFKVLIYNESSLTYMDISDIEEVRLDVFSSDRVERFTLTSPVTYINISANYQYMNLWFIYNSTTSYYRSLVPNYENISINYTDFYMVDINEIQTVLWDISVIDLTGDYSDNPIFITKLTDDNGTIEIIRQFPDIQNAVHLYLMKDETYNLNMFDDDGVLRVIGSIEAKEDADKVMTLPWIDFKPDFYLDDNISVDITHDETANILRVVYSDTSELTYNVTIRIYNGSDPSQSLANYTTAADSFSYTYTINPNASYILNLIFCNTVLGCKTHRQTYGIPTPTGPDFSWIAPNGSNYTRYKKVIGLAAMTGTVLLFPGEYVAGAIILLMVEIFVFPHFGLLELNTVTISLFSVLLAISILRVVIKKR